MSKNHFYRGDDKMLILAHRGIWKDEREKNTLPALKRALSEGFGIETEV